MRWASTWASASVISIMASPRVPEWPRTGSAAWCPAQRSPATGGPPRGASSRATDTASELRVPQDDPAQLPVVEHALLVGVDDLLDVPTPEGQAPAEVVIPVVLARGHLDVVAEEPDGGLVSHIL